MKTIQYSSSWLRLGLAGLVLAGCTKMDDKYKPYLSGGEVVYQVQPDSIMIFPGHDRIQLDWQLTSNPNVTHGRVYWNNGADSVDAPVTPGGKKDHVSVLIDPIPEGSYTFSIVTFDKAGHVSVPVDTIGRVYGDVYISTLTNRRTSRAVLIGGKPKIEWLSETDSTAVGTEIRYLDQQGAEQHIFVKTTDSITTIAEPPLGDSVQYRSLFIPVSGALDTFAAYYQPIYLEEAVPVELDRNKYEEYTLPGDAPQYNTSANPMSKLWDGDKNSWFRTANNSGSPHWFTFDLGVTAKLSSFKAWQRGILTEYNLVYANANAKTWEVWGSADPNPDGSWDSWVKLGDCQSVKPSGLPLGQTTEEDLAYALAGETFSLDPAAPPVRYIRIKVLDTWDGAAKDHSFFSGRALVGVAE